MKVEPENAKALYRRGVAKLHVGLLDTAENDLLAAKEKSSNGKTHFFTSAFSFTCADKDVKLRLQELATKRKEFVQKEKEMYTAMFNQ